MFSFYEVRGVQYGVQVEGGGRPLLLLHGFTGSSRNWAPLLPKLTASHKVIAPDLLGHGRTEAPSDPARYQMAEASADLLALLQQLDIDQVDVVGYSMGGRLALHFACTYPKVVRTLTLESSSPGLADESGRAARKSADDSLGGRIERESLEAFVDFWQGLKLWDSQIRLPVEVRDRVRALRLENRPLGLANSLRGMGTGVQPDLWPYLATLSMPVQLLTGEFDAKFVGIAQEMSRLIRQVRHQTILEAGHTVHLEQADAWCAAVLDWARQGV